MEILCKTSTCHSINMINFNLLFEQCNTKYQLREHSNDQAYWVHDYTCPITSILFDRLMK